MEGDEFFAGVAGEIEAVGVAVEGIDVDARGAGVMVVKPADVMEDGVIGFHPGTAGIGASADGLSGG